MTEKNELPLAGIRVLEFSHAVLGPACGVILADLGAEVIKVEPAPAGDPTRQLKGFGMGYFPMFNRNKKSIAVNVKTPEGKEIIHKLLVETDVLVKRIISQPRALSSAAATSRASLIRVSCVSSSASVRPRTKRKLRCPSLVKV